MPANEAPLLRVGAIEPLDGTHDAALLDLARRLLELKNMPVIRNDTSLQFVDAWLHMDAFHSRRQPEVDIRRAIMRCRA